MDTKQNLHCPICGNVLTKIQTGNIIVDACENGCGGIWFDKGELDKVNEPDEKAGIKLLNITKKAGIQIDKSKQKLCPVCHVSFYNYSITLGIPFNIDECPECGGFWLDEGELSLLRGNSDMANKDAFNYVEGNSKLKEATKPMLAKLYDFLSGL